ncbi:MAG: YihY family inner membrane protein [Gammaproteobacteria bacterium]|nr:YihY family inner membrane protein [Gammaproteobacteria bacterium]
MTQAPQRHSSIIATAWLFIRAISTDIRSGRITLWAGSMVYTTLLSLVPLIAVSFSLLKAFGVHNQLRPLLNELLTPLGEQGQILSHNIITAVDQVQVGVLGVVGVVFLFVTVVLMISRVEEALNEQWQTQDVRPWHSRIGYYLSALILAPPLVVSAFSFLGALFSASLPYAPALLLTLWPKITIAVPLFVTVLAFMLIYLFLPFTTVRPGAALIGALFSTATWKLSGWAFASIISHASHYDAIYSGFTIVIVLMMWLYLSWLIFILGARIAFYCQQPHAMHFPSRMPPSTDQELLALNLMFRIGLHFRQGIPGPTQAQLSLALGQNDHAVAQLLHRLEQSGLVNQLRKGKFVPAKALDSISLFDIVSAVDDTASQAPLPDCPALQEVRQQYARARQQALVAISLNHWLQQSLIKNPTLK